jgi:hypothetical protein
MDRKGSKDNKEAFERLAAHACELISSVVIVQQEGQRAGRPLTPELEYNLGVLVRYVMRLSFYFFFRLMLNYSSSKLRPIEEFVHGQTERHKVARFVMHKVDAGKVLEYRDKLMYALAEFGVSDRANIYH